MGKGRKPSLLPHPAGKQKRRWIWLVTQPMGNLKCSWTHMVESHEDEMERMDVGRGSFIKYSMILWVPPIIIGPLFGLIYGQWLVGLIIGIMVSITLGFLYAFFFWTLARNIKDPNFTRNVKAGWNDVGYKLAMQSLKRFVEQYGKPYKFARNKKIMSSGGWMNPEDIYKFSDGVVIKARISIKDNPRAGWLSICYKPAQWEQALELQLAMDDFMFEHKILNRRVSRRSGSINGNCK